MRIQVNDTTLNVLEQSTISNRHSAIVAPALVFLHYFGGSSRAWTKVIERLSNEHRCIAPDLRGFGDSDAPVADYKLSDSAGDVAALIEALQLERYILVGHSMGGKIALSFAAKQPRGLESLILVAPSPPTPEPIPEDERARLLATHGERRAAEETLRKITAHPLPADLFETVIEDNLRSSKQAWRAWLEDESRADISASVPDIAVPTLIVSGAADQAIPTMLLEREVVPRIKRARITVVPDAGHLLPLEVPQLLAELIRAQTLSPENSFPPLTLA